jgi:hypothetical protein
MYSKCKFEYENCLGLFENENGRSKIRRQKNCGGGFENDRRQLFSGDKKRFDANLCFLIFIIQSHKANMDFQRIIPFLLAKDIGNFALVNRNFYTAVLQKGVCLDVVTVFVSDLHSLVFPMKFVQCAIKGITKLPVKICDDAVVPVAYEFDREFNQSLVPGVLPPSLTSLTFGEYFNQPLAPGVLPSSLTSLVFGEEFNQSLVPGVLPLSLTSLVLGFYFDQPMLPGVLPPLLTSLVFGYFFNRPIKLGVLPPSLTSLVFGTEFDQFIGQGVLPPSLTFLKFGHCFQQPFLHEVYPPSLKSINYCPCKPTVFL